MRQRKTILLAPCLYNRKKWRSMGHLYLFQRNTHISWIQLFWWGFTNLTKVKISSLSTIFFFFLNSCWKRFWIAFHWHFQLLSTCCGISKQQDRWESSWGPGWVMICSLLTWLFSLRLHAQTCPARTLSVQRHRAALWSELRTIIVHMLDCVKFKEFLEKFLYLCQCDTRVSGMTFSIHYFEKYHKRTRNQKYICLAIK